jgi:hypothetical protein
MWDRQGEELRGFGGVTSGYFVLDEIQAAAGVDPADLRQGEAAEPAVGLPPATRSSGPRT